MNGMVFFAVHTFRIFDCPVGEGEAEGGGRGGDRERGDREEGGRKEGGRREE